MIDLNEFPYGIWIPGMNKKRIELIRRWTFVQILNDGSCIYYINGKRIRTPTEVSSNPCINCGHCVDSYISFCGNKKCIKDRRKRKLCEKDISIHREGWIHEIDIKSNMRGFWKKGVKYHWDICKICNKEIKWIGNYQQDYHCIEYLKYCIKERKRHENIKISIEVKKIKFSSRVAIGELRHLCLQRDKYKCRECGTTKEDSPLEIDHIVPYSKGGLTILENLQTLCRRCNRSKHTREWIGGNE